MRLDEEYRMRGRVYHAKYNISRRYTNCVSDVSIKVLRDERGYTIAWGGIYMSRHTCRGCEGVEGAVECLQHTADELQGYRDKEGRKHPANILYLAYTSDIKLVYADIKDIPGVHAYLKSGTEPLYIDVGEHVRIIQSKHTPEFEHTQNKKCGVICYNATSYVRAMLAKNWTDKGTKWTHERIRSMYPDETLYRACMKWLYRGGKVFSLANPKRAYVCVDALDMTSAHIWGMLTQKYPTTYFKRVNAEMGIECAMSGHLAVILDITFKGIAPRLGIGWENKRMTCMNPILQGKGILYADSMRVMLTEVDWQTYMLVYKWDECKVNAAWVAHKNPLPSYLRKTVIDAAVDKQRLKHAGVKGEEYDEAKRRANMLYGMTAQKLNLTTCGGDGKGVSIEYDKAISHRILSPFWAVWTVAYTRYMQARMISELAKLGISSLYGDTDSVYMSTVFDWTLAQSKLNSIARAANVKSKLPDELLDLGTWTYEYYPRFKCLGAKQYMYMCEDGHIEYKVSGVLGGALDGVDFEDFEESLEVKNARRIIVKKPGQLAHYEYENVRIGECADMCELSHWYERYVLNI